MTLILTLCSATACFEHRQPATTLMECMTGLTAQVYAAERGLTIQAMRCERGVRA